MLCNKENNLIFLQRVAKVSTPPGFEGREEQGVMLEPLGDVEPVVPQPGTTRQTRAVSGRHQGGKADRLLAHKVSSTLS